MHMGMNCPFSSSKQSAVQFKIKFVTMFINLKRVIFSVFQKQNFFFINILPESQYFTNLNQSWSCLFKFDFHKLKISFSDLTLTTDWTLGRVLFVERCAGTQGNPSEHWITSRWRPWFASAVRPVRPAQLLYVFAHISVELSIRYLAGGSHDSISSLTLHDQSFGKLTIS